MVSKCANPSCGASFQYLRSGKLFLLDLRHSRTVSENGSAAVSKRGAAEYFWLCDQCCSQLTVVVGRNGPATVAKARAFGQR
jgi:hypothetical protein